MFKARGRGLLPDARFLRTGAGICAAKEGSRHAETSKKSRPSSSRRPAFRQLRRYEQALPRGKGVQLIELRVDGKNLLLRGPWISSHTTRRGEKVKAY